MIPVAQTVFGPQGNCYAACVASIFELPIDQVLDLRSDGRTWADLLRKWVKSRGASLRFVMGDGRTLAEQSDPPRGWSILGQRPPGRPVHAVVCRDGVVVHDPAPVSLVVPESLVLLWTTFEGCP